MYAFVCLYHCIFQDEDNMFRELTFKELIQNAEPISDPDEEYWLSFNNKEPLPERKS